MQKLRVDNEDNIDNNEEKEIKKNTVHYCTIVKKGVVGTQRK